MGSDLGGWGMLYAQEFDAVCKSCTSSEATLYASLVTMRNPKTMATPPLGVALIVEKTGMPRRTVFRCLSRLTEIGLITKAKRGSRVAYGFPLVNGKVPPVALIDATSGTQHIQHKQ